MITLFWIKQIDTENNQVDVQWLLRSNGQDFNDDVKTW